MVGEASGTPAFPTLQTIDTLAVKPFGTEDCQVELFVGLT